MDPHGSKRKRDGSAADEGVQDGSGEGDSLQPFLAAFKVPSLSLSCALQPASSDLLVHCSGLLRQASARAAECAGPPDASLRPAIVEILIWADHLSSEAVTRHDGDGGDGF